MRGIKNKIIAISIGTIMACAPVSYVNMTSIIVAEAHSGRTDANGGHKDNKNKSGLGSYHYHCGGHPAHLHPDGVCPYSSGSANAAASGSASDSGTDTELVKKVQQALNDKGYDCGEPDGLAGEKTKNALMKFQEDNNLTADGVIGEQVKTALGIS